jgi:uncharacterized coiled-coil protein SlyX
MKLPTITPSLPLIGYTALGACALGIWGGWHFGSGHWQTKYEALQAQGWQARAVAESTARKAVEGRLATLQTNLTHNEKVIHDLQTANTAVVADSGSIRDQLRRLRAQASRSCPSGDALPVIPDRPPAAGTGGDESDDRLPRLAGDAIDECKRNANRLNAIIQQVLPQLGNR